MSFWPRLRRRSRGRKRSSSKPNPYSSIGLEKLALVHAEFDTQRALFAAEKGVPVSVVRFISGSSRGWTLLPRAAVSSGPDKEQEFIINQRFASSSSTSTEPSSPATGSTPLGASFSLSEGEERGQNPSTFLFPSQSPPGEEQRLGEEIKVSSDPEVTGGSQIKSLKTDGQVILSGKNQAWSKVPESPSVLLVSLGVSSAALAVVSTAFALIIGSWSRGKSSLSRIFSILTTHLVSVLKPSLLLKRLSKKLISPAEAEMKVVPPVPISPIVARENESESRLSSFSFPILSRDNSGGTPIFRALQDQEEQLELGRGQQQPVEATAPVVTAIKVVAVTSQPGSPAFDGSKGAQKPCQKLKARIFKCHPPRKVTPATSENSSTEDDASVSEGLLEADAAIKARVTDSPISSPRCKRISFMKRRSKSGKSGESEEQSAADSEFEDVSSSVTRVVTVKASMSEEILVSRNPNSNASPAAVPVKKVSRSEELKLSLRNLKKKKCKSQELSSSLTNVQEPVALESTSIKGLEELAFPFNHETDSSACSTPTTPRPKYRCILTKKLSLDSDKSGDLSSALQSPRSNTSTSRLSKSVTTPLSRISPEKTCVMDLKPDLRKVKTTVARVPLPADYGELSRSRVLDREILGSLLVLAVLLFLLVGKITAILGTACLCLVLSHIQRFLSNNMTPRERELLASRNGGTHGLSRLGESNPPNSFMGSPVHDVQSKEYRKKVLIEGYTQRGSRRMV